MNFWGFILNGATQIFLFFVGFLPLAQPNELIVSAPGMVEQAIIPVFFWTAPIFDLRLAGVALGFLIVLEGVRAVIAIWRWILSLIPTAS